MHAQIRELIRQIIIRSRKLKHPISDSKKLNEQEQRLVFYPCDTETTILIAFFHMCVGYWSILVVDWIITIVTKIQQGKETPEYWAKSSLYSQKIRRSTRL